MDQPTTTPSSSKHMQETNVNQKRNKRKNENQPENKPENKKIQTELEKPIGSSKDNVVKLDTVSDYTKRSRLEFNFWEDLINPSNNLEENVLEIKDLKVGNYIGKRLKIRITFKSNVRQSRSGHVFNLHDMDNSSEIAIVIFGDDSTRLSEELMINMVYYLEHFVVENENVSYPSGTGNVLQIKLNGKSKFQIVDDYNFPKIVFNFVSLNSIQSSTNNEKVDILGILVKDHGLETTYRNSKKRDLALTDESKGTGNVTLWGADATNFDCKLYSVIIIRRGTISEFEGKNKINCLYGTLIWCNPQMPEAIKLKKWFMEEQLKFKHK